MLVENYHQFPSSLNFGSSTQFFAPVRGQQSLDLFVVAAFLAFRASLRPLLHPGAGRYPAGLAPVWSKLTWLALGGDHEDPSRGGEQAIALGRL